MARSCVSRESLLRVGNTTINKVTSTKILFLVALLVIIGFLGTHDFAATGKEPIERPMIILGLSKIEPNQNETVGVQVDRVIRTVASDGRWSWVNVSPNRIPENSSDIVPYAEGARVREMVNWSRVKVLPLGPCRAKKFGNYYFAADGRGNFSFLISPSKITFPPFSKTVIWPKKGSNETADLICPQTHGFNMIAERAYLHRKDINLAVACMDLPAKALAALYLAKNGIDIYAPCDRFASHLMNYKKKYGVNATILGSAPIRQNGSGAIIGDQPVAIYLDEPIVVECDNKNDTPNQYCDAPWRYFNRLNQVYCLNLTLIKVFADDGEAGKVVRQAEAVKAQVIGVRVCEKGDYGPVAEWLKKDIRNRAVLLHSAVYEPGDMLFEEFPTQTTFGDLNPVIEGTIPIPSHIDSSPNQANVNYIYEKNLPLHKDIVLKMNMLFVKGPGVSGLPVHFLLSLSPNGNRSLFAIYH